MAFVSFSIHSGSLGSRTQRRILGRIVSTRPDPALLVARVVLGAVMFAHGAQKSFGWFGGPGLQATFTYFSEILGIPGLLTALVILAEVLGGLGLVVGCLGRIAAGGILMVMTGAAAIVHLRHGFFMNWSGKQEGEGIEYHLLALALTILILFRGCGAYSVDRRLAQILR